MKTCKEVDAVKLPAYPTPQQYHAWKSAIRNEVKASSSRSEEAFRCVLKKADSKKVPVEDIRDSKGLDSLDAKLASALAKLATGDLVRRISLAGEKLALSGQMMKGRQASWMIHDYRKLDEERGALYDYTDLIAVRL